MLIGGWFFFPAKYLHCLLLLYLRTSKQHIKKKKINAIFLASSGYPLELI